MTCKHPSNSIVDLKWRPISEEAYRAGYVISSLKPGMLRWCFAGWDEPQARVCKLCRAWLPLGPSNDDDERVRVEMRAAEISALLSNDAALYDWTLSNEEFVSFTAFEERRGWSVAESSMRNHSNAWLAGYLARCIWTHCDDHKEP